MIVQNLNIKLTLTRQVENLTFRTFRNSMVVLDMEKSFTIIEACVTRKARRNERRHE